MHPQQVNFIKRVVELYPTKFIGANVLDIGSLDVNGNNRQFFYQCEYTGLDVGGGPNVDLVYDGEEIPFSSASFDTVISTECMEHNPHWRTTMTEMVRVLKPGGLLIMTMAAYKRPEHGTSSHDPVASPFTNDYYKNILISDLASVLAWEEKFFPISIEYGGAYDLYFYGIKSYEIPEDNKS